jgi:hypothetical protein
MKESLRAAIAEDRHTDSIAEDLENEEVLMRQQTRRCNGLLI